MTSLNKYYDFLKDNNITNVELLKEFIGKEQYKLKFKEDSNLILIFNDNNSNLQEELVRFFNGVIIDKETLKIICYTFDKCFEENNINENLFGKNIKIQPVYEGTLIRAYFYNNKWNLSTKKMINAHNAKWASDKSFGDMFNEIIGIDNLNNETYFNNKDYCYSFLMGHVENNIIQNNSNYIIHLNTVDLVNNSEVNFSDNTITYDDKIKHINHYGNVEINMEKDSLIKHIQNIKNDTGLNEIGYMFINQDNEKQKFMKNNYIQIRELWGNTNNRLFRYLNLRKNPENLKSYLSIFPSDKKLFLDYEHYLMNIATFILNIYRDRHMTKKITKVPFYIRDIIYKIHGLYLQTKNKVTFNDINVILHDLDEKKFCYIINNIEKDKKKLDENKQQEQLSQDESNEIQEMET